MPTNYIEQLGQQVGNSLAGTGMGLLLEGHNDRRQRNQQRKLQEIQIAGNKEMTDYQMMKQLEMWKATSYEAQKEQMIKAGLNPALMYGMSGGGGTTTGNASGNVQGANAPQGGHEIYDAMGINMQAAQLSLLNAQKKNIDADTANKMGDAANKPLVGKNIQADTTLKESQTAIADITADIQGRSSNMAVAMIETTLRKLTEELQIQVNTRKISDETMKDEIRKVKEEAIGMFLKNAQTDTQTKAIATELAQKWEALRIQGRQLTYTAWEAAIKQQLADYTTTHPNIGQVTGGLVDKILKLLNIN